MAFQFFKKKEVKETIRLDKNLYILAEIRKPGLVNYMEANNMHVKVVATDVNKLILSLLREKDPIRLVIIDYGLGKYKSLEQIESIIGAIGSANQKLGQDEENNCTVFTKNGALINAIKEAKYNVDIKEYRGASDVVRALLEYPEDYVTPGAQDIEGAPSSDLIAYKYSWKSDRALKSDRVLKSSKASIDITNVDPTVESDDMLQGFNCKF